MDPIYALGRILDPIFALGRILDPIFALGRILDPISPPCSTVTMVNVQIDFYYVISARLYNNAQELATTPNGQPPTVHAPHA